MPDTVLRGRARSGRSSVRLLVGAALCLLVGGALLLHAFPHRDRVAAVPSKPAPPPPPPPTWPQWGGTLSRNMVSDEENLPSSFSVGVPGSQGTWQTPPVNLKWMARLGSQTYGTPTVAGGRVLIGTNNNGQRNPRLTGDRLVLMCFSEADGRFLWQFASPTPFYHGQFSICGLLGVCASAAMDDTRAYVVTSRCHLVCLDLNPLGVNEPTYAKEAEYLAQPLSERFSIGPNGPQVALKPRAPVKLTPQDANMVWVFDMMTKAGSWPHDANSSSVLLVDDIVYAGTGNGKAANERTVLSPKGPSVIALDKRTGQLLAKDDAGIAAHTFGGQWSSPSYGVVKGRPLVFYGGGDGLCYAFDAHAALTPEGKPGVLQKVWQCDANTPEARERRYLNAAGPNEVVGTPVFHENRIYVTCGQDPHHGLGKGCLTCLDATQTGNITQTGVIWRFKGIGRSVSTPSVADGLVYVPDLAGVLYCVDAATGELVWSQNLGGQVWGSTLCADGKVYVGTGRGQLWIMKAGRQKQVLSTVSMRAPVYTTPVAVGGVLYVASHRYLYAVSKQAGAGQIVGN